MRRRAKVDLGPRYRFLSELGRGGLGTVYRVFDTHLGEELALKLLHDPPASPEDVDEAQREFAVLSRIEHPSIARAHDFGYLRGRPYFTRALIRGEPLSGRGAVKDAGELVTIALDLARAAAFLHQSRLLHLDIKPSNVILEAGKTPPRAVLIDFGLCRHGRAGSPGLRRKGSLPYVAPEFFRDEPLGPWTDVYALGVTLYRLATGRYPRPGAAAGAAAMKNGAAWLPAPAPLSRFRRGLPADFERVTIKCLALDPAARFQSGAELLEALSVLPRLAQAPAADRAAPPAALMLGRSAELEKAERFLARLAAREAGPPALLITGPPGIGQSHFLNEVKVRAQMRGLHVYLERGFPGKTTAPGALWRCLERQAADRGARRRWRAFLARLEEARHDPRDDTTEADRRLRRASEAIATAAALEEPLLVVIDGLQHFDEISIGLTADLVRQLLDETASRRPPLGIIAGYREEGPSIPILRELTGLLLAPGKGDSLALGPLSIEASADLHRLHAEAAGHGSAAPGLELFQETGGVPRAIVSLAAAGAQPPPAPGSAHLSTPVGDEARRLLLVLTLLERPAEEAEAARIAGLSHGRARRLLAGLETAGLAVAGGAERGAREWLPGSGAAAIVAGISRAARAKVHLRIAADLNRRSARHPRSLEAVSHYRRAGSSAELIRHGIPAAEYLMATYQNRSALELLKALLEVVPEARHALRNRLGLLMAEVQARVGDFEEGIRILQESLVRPARLPRGASLLTRLRLATLHGRRGDFQRADALFAEALDEARRVLRPEELLSFLNEHSALKLFMGDGAAAMRLCLQGLELAARKGGTRARELSLHLLATRANIALRAFDFDTAIADFQRALEIAEAAGALGSQAMVLNNLGLAYSQSDRYDEAARAFREAHRICSRLDDGPSLTSILGNLAVVHAKRGHFESMDEALAAAERLRPGALGPRQEFFLRHCRGLALLYRGRFADAQPHLEEAIRLGASIGDRHVVGFDEVFRAEALLFQGSHAAAASELERLTEPGRPVRLRKMALARRALLFALLADDSSARAAAREHGALAGDREVPFLDAWDALFLGWADSILGRHEAAMERLEKAEAFFRERRLGPSLSLALWIKAESLHLSGDPGGAARAAAGASAGRPPAGNDLTRALWPLLAARLSLSRPIDGEAASQAADLLAEAGAALVGNPLPEWEARLEALRSRMTEPADQPAAASDDGPRMRIARVLREPERRRYLESAYWAAWVPAAGGARKKRRPRRAMREAIDERTAVVARGGAIRPPPRLRLIARSGAMGALRALLDRLRSSDLPVCIWGETGTGKELVARLIHEESRRSSGPFQVLDCATLPQGLLEAELFGARAGAFTGIERDRPGILALAERGTVLVEGIGGAPLEAQAKLLRAISEKTIRPLGAAAEESIDVRFIVSEVRDLEQAVKEGRLREDLFHRLRGITLRVPPLRERKEDLPELARLILEDCMNEPPAVERGVLEKLAERSWPGNVRELKNLLVRLAMESPARISTKALARLLADDPREEPPATLFPGEILARQSLPALKERLERDYLVHHFRRLGGDTAALRRFLGLSERHFYRRCQQLGVSLRTERRGLQG